MNGKSENLKILGELGPVWAQKNDFYEKIVFFAVFSIFKQVKKPIAFADFKILLRIILLQHVPWAEEVSY